MENITDAEVATAVTNTTNLTGITPTDVTRISGGINETFYIDTNNSRYVVKFNTFSPYTDFLAELKLLNFLDNRTLLPTPTVTHTATDRTHELEPFFVMECLPGERPTAFVDRYTPRIARQMGFIISRLDTLPEDATSGGYGRITPESDDRTVVASGMDSWREYYQTYVQSVLDGANRMAPDEFQPYLDSANDALDDYLPAVPETPNPAIMLPDFRLGNILVDDNQTVSGVLDFERAAIGDAQFTLINTEYLLSRRLATPTQRRVKDDLHEGFVHWPDADVADAYRFGAVLREVRGFDYWWDDASDDVYQTNLNRVCETLDDLLSK